MSVYSCSFFLPFLLALRQVYLISITLIKQLTDGRLVNSIFK